MFAKLEVNGDGAADLYTWLKEQQLPNGLFSAVAGRDETGDPLVTVRAMGVIKQIESSRPRRSHDNSAEK